MDIDSKPIVVEETYAVPPETVWNAITERNQMRQWFFDQMTEFTPEVGFKTEFTVHHENLDFPHLWELTHVEPNRRIVYNWKYGGQPGDSTVEWVLSETPEGTKLTLTHTGMDTFPQDIAAFRRDSCQGGWSYFLCDNLKKYLEDSESQSSFKESVTIPARGSTVMTDQNASVAATKNMKMF